MKGKARLLAIVTTLAMAGAGMMMSAATVTAHAGEGMTHMIEMAKTRADHEAIAAKYEEEAKALQAKADEHAAMAKSYKALETAGGKGPKLAEHCDSLTAKYKAAAEDNLTLAQMHRDMAAQAE